MEIEIAYRAKILAIRKSAYQRKDMKVDMGGNRSYAAMSESGVLNTLQPLLDEHMIDVVCIDVESISANSTHFKAIYTYKMIDCETGFSEIIKYAGSGTDKSDKDTGKAGTYAFKNMLVKRFFMISGEDAENTSSDSQQKSVRNELNNNIADLRRKGYFGSPQNNPQNTEQGEINAFNVFMTKVEENSNDVSWLMEKNNQIINLLSKSK